MKYLFILLLGLGLAQEYGRLCVNNNPSICMDECDYFYLTPDPLESCNFPLLDNYLPIKYFNDVTDAITYGFDGFIVATPAETHFKLGKCILENKTPVLIEKPITTKLEDAIELNNIARENKVNLMVGHVLLFHPAFIKIKQMLD